MATKQVSVVVAPSFNPTATAILKATKAMDLAGSKWSVAVTSSMQRYIDTCMVTEGFGKDEASCKAMQKAIRESQVVIDAVAAGVIEQKTFTEYAQGAARALHFGIEWSPTLKNDPAYKLPWGRKSTPATAKAGKVTVTDRAALEATLQKALQQARALSLDGFASEMLDVITETLDGFTEAKGE